MSGLQILEQLGLGDAPTWLAEFIPQQRWFGGRGRELREVTVADAAVLVRNHLTLVLTLVTVTDASGRKDHYQVPLGVRERRGSLLEHAGAETVIAEIEHEGTVLAVYDALADPDCARVLWEGIAAGRTWPAVHGRLVGRAEAEGLEGTPDEVIHPLGREQSNTSLVRGGRDLLKCMRRIEMAPSVELEMTLALDRAGFRHMAPALGMLEYHREGGPEGPILLAMVQPYLHNGTDGWAMALTSLRDLYADAELDGVPADPEERRRRAEEQGGAFTPEASRLGEVTAEMHAALAADHSAEAMRRAPVDAQMLQRWADTMVSELDQLLVAEDPRLDPLRDRRDALRARLAALAEVADAGFAIRIHGDYHLGQVLRTDEGWTVLDFEGEPVRSVPERRERWPALRDVAGMLRSFDYAAAAALGERMSPDDVQWGALFAQGDAWAHVNRAAFWEAYTRTAGPVEGLLPVGEDALLVCRAFELHKAIYEVRYELAHRPEWVGIPLTFLLAATVT